MLVTLIIVFFFRNFSDVFVSCLSEKIASKRKEDHRRLRRNLCSCEKASKREFFEASISFPHTRHRNNI